MVSFQVVWRIVFEMHGLRLGVIEPGNELQILSHTLVDTHLKLIHKLLLLTCFPCESVGEANLFFVRF